LLSQLDFRDSGLHCAGIHLKNSVFSASIGFLNTEFLAIRDDIHLGLDVLNCLSHQGGEDSVDAVCDLYWSQMSDLFSVPFLVQ
jgi:hypothetical protein